MTDDENIVLRKTLIGGKAMAFYGKPGGGSGSGDDLEDCGWHGRRCGLGRRTKTSPERTRCGGDAGCNHGGARSTRCEGREVI